MHWRNYSRLNHLPGETIVAVLIKKALVARKNQPHLQVGNRRIIRGYLPETPSVEASFDNGFRNYASEALKDLFHVGVL